MRNMHALVFSATAISLACGSSLAAPGVRPAAKPPLPPAHAAQAGPGSPLALKGRITGAWSRPISDPDGGEVVNLTGAGNVAPLGEAQATGTINGPGRVARGTTTGTLTLTPDGGTLSLRLTGPPQRGASSPSSRLSYKITGGTGAFAGKTGQGAVRLTLTPPKPPRLIPGKPPPPFGAATFRLEFVPR